MRNLVFFIAVLLVLAVLMITVFRVDAQAHISWTKRCDYPVEVYAIKESPGSVMVVCYYMPWWPDPPGKAKK